MQTNSLFVDTSGWMASLVASEMYHAEAEQEMRQALGNPRINVYTTDLVITELVALMIGRRVQRTQILHDVNNIIIAPRIHKLYTDPMLFEDAWNLLRERPDKAWSLVDAVSILHMQRLGMTEALTNDHHFEQAGFTRLLK